MTSTQARITARADALHAHADGIIPGGTAPFTKAPTVSGPARAIASAIDDVDGYTAMGEIANARRAVTVALGAAGRTMDRARVNGLAQRAMAALGREADTTRPASRGYRPAYLDGHLIGDFHPVGPYVGDAVEWVLRGVEHTTADRDLIRAYAVLHNVVTRRL